MEIDQILYGLQALAGMPQGFDLRAFAAWSHSVPWAAVIEAWEWLFVGTFVAALSTGAFASGRIRVHPLSLNVLSAASLLMVWLSATQPDSMDRISWPVTLFPIGAWFAGNAALIVVTFGGALLDAGMNFTNAIKEGIREALREQEMDKLSPAERDLVVARDIFGGRGRTVEELADVNAEVRPERFYRWIVANRLRHAVMLLSIPVAVAAGGILASDFSTNLLGVLLFVGAFGVLSGYMVGRRINRRVRLVQGAAARPAAAHTATAEAAAAN